jgi:hypothetical protein
MFVMVLMFMKVSSPKICENSPKIFLTIPEVLVDTGKLNHDSWIKKREKERERNQLETSCEQPLHRGHEREVVGPIWKIRVPKFQQVKRLWTPHC